ncbi:MAG: electron transport complex subunit RsxD [Methylotenera sp. 24-45-7]|nr:MAG: electron transport complex subunit RsxD [Mehylophilales bacterium 35-46-6]OYZ41927.1 MAG: electron transport complex subunit RsxD [Methylotenera sp. 24-45-7]OZA07267.1 MAG: electron transport complex subunit RsxD [Methylotenera sp. 17-45-7]OZA53576.1 MAG: electron transport complex subunit RsxD [Methylophilales bacterium 39-45-7]HQS37388.1 electron transport complex subunit RsxD [Methylotenera sp.]
MNRSPYVSDAPSVSIIMLKVLLALVPGIFVYAWVFGGGILVTISLATLTALIAEAALLKIRQRPIKPYLSDLSAVVTAWLLALSLPPLAPWWLVVVATLFAIIVAKQLYGGLGYNPFNPAMAGYAAMLISFPIIMTKWPAPLLLAQTPLSFMDQLGYIFAHTLPSGVTMDAVTSATPLDYLKTQLMLKQEVSAITQAPIFGAYGAKGGELVTVAYLLGGLYLVQQRIISWHLPTAFLAALAAISLIFYGFDSAHYANPLFHLMSGASMLCAFFIITDPVSGPTTPRGKLYFAAGIGILTYLIRVYGGYPDGVAFAVLIMNMFVPIIDAATQPRVFGHKE